ncbi:MAG TPA: helix-turn-helix domain-containing protein [Pirellula sp.]|nr:helix-turn-helix domain-containing protein [Pirellula sp.]
MANYVSLDEAAKILGIPPDELVEMRSRGEIFGYRDGSSWKFKTEEIERVQSELDGDALDEEAGGSSILVSEKQVGPSGSKSGPTIGGSVNSDLKLGSDLNLAGDEERTGSDVALVPDPKSGSGVRLVNRKTGSDGVNKEKEGGKKSNSALSDIQLKKEGGSGSEVELGSELNLLGEDSGHASSLNVMSNKKNVADSDNGNFGLGSDLELADDDEDDLVLGSDSGVGLASESGINLMSPSDSGLSLEDEPLDLAGTGISGLDLGAEVKGGSGAGSASGISGLGSGALVDFQQGEEFQLTPSSGGIEVDDDSGSQVIELEDSSEFGDIPDGGGIGGFDPIDEQGGFGGDGLGGEAGLAGGAMAAGMRGVPETPYSTPDVLLLMGILLLMGLGGLLVSDLMRNMWAWDNQNDYTSGLTSMLVNAIGGK